MRVRHWVLIGSASVVFGGVLAGGCGGTSSSPPTQDAGNDVVADHTAPVDTGPDVAEAAAVCKSDANLDNLGVPDASLGDGASSVGICLGCVHTSCESELLACNADCDCKTAIVSVLPCVLAGGAIFTCGAPLINLTGNSQALGVALGTCLQNSCQPQCLPAPPPKDSGSDAPSDAPADG